MSKNVILIFVSIVSVLLFFQNCSDGVSFSQKSVDSTGLEQPQDVNTSEDEVPLTIESNYPVVSNPPNTVCNPLNPEDTCVGVTPEMGLQGQLYYMTSAQHESLFNDDLRNAMIDDYRDFGILVPADIIMTAINVTPRSWESGFFLSSGEQVKKADGDELFEWFHLDLSGFIELPEGAYQFATLSDDGMRVTLNDEVIINHDGAHAPAYRCAQAPTIFVGGEKKRIRVEYFQGPRTQIAMVLLARPLTDASGPLDDQACSDFRDDLVNLPEGSLTRY